MAPMTDIDVAVGEALAEPGGGETGRLFIDAGALRDNYFQLSKAAPGTEAAAVVKADAYGLGAREAVPVLMAAGCRTFFVATLAEALVIRELDRDITIYALDGLITNTGDRFVANNIRPVLSSMEEIEEWAATCTRGGAKHPAAIHLDTGMARLGMTGAEVERLLAAPGLLDAFEPTLLMSHLACGDEPAHPLNAIQIERFEGARRRLPAMPASLANSAGTLAHPESHYDLIRPGIALYGGRAVEGRSNPMKPIVRLYARIAQVRDIEADTNVSYGATQVIKAGSRLATVTVGYADGYFRHLGATDDKRGAHLMINDRAAPIVGRVTMDLTIVDVTAHPAGSVRRGGWAEVIGPHISVDDIADKAGTIGYEVLTGLGARHQRTWLNL